MSNYRDWARTKWAAFVKKELTPQASSLVNGAMGLSDEAGEVLGLVKKHVFHGHPLDDRMRAKLIDELGDVRFYQTMLMIDLGITDADVEQANQRKLNARYKGVLTPEESLNRKPEAIEATK
jgi:NTP pyrophosphatase (non-canonical NTP hydrolase)